MNVLDYVHPDDLPHVVLEENKRAPSEGDITTKKVEYRFRHKDGSWRWIESVSTYLLDDPAVGGVMITSRDVTERKESEERVRRAEERYRTLVERLHPRGVQGPGHEVAHGAPRGPRADAVRGRADG
jgi:PAS domain-containing protein